MAGLKWSPGCNCCETLSCDLFTLNGTLVDPTSSGFSTDYVGTYPTSFDGIVIPANSYLEWDTAIPTNGFRFYAHGYISGFSYTMLPKSLEIVVVNSSGTEIMSLSLNASGTYDSFDFLVEGSTVTFTCDDEYAFEDSAFGCSAFHALTVTNGAAQSTRINNRDQSWPGLDPAGATWTRSDESGLTVETDVELALSVPMSSVLPSGCKIRLVNTSGSDVTIGEFGGKKVEDTDAPLNSTCDDERKVCLIARENSINRWVPSFTWTGSGVTGATIITEILENCAYYAESNQASSLVLGDDTVGEIDAAYGIEYARYTGSNVDGSVDATYDKWRQITDITYTAPDAPSNTTCPWNVTVVPKAHGTDSSKVLLDVTLNLTVAGIQYDGTAPGGNTTITSPGSTVTATNEYDQSYASHFVWPSPPVMTSTSVTPSFSNGLSPPSLLGVCYDDTSDLQKLPGESVDSYMTGAETTPLSGYETENELNFPAIGAYYVSGLSISVVWTDVEVAKWSGTTPTVNLSASTADSVQVNGSSYSATDDYIFNGTSSTALNSSSFPCSRDLYTPNSSNPTGSFSGDVVSSSGTCPVHTGSSALSFNVTAAATFARVTWTNLSLTLTGA